MWNWSEALLFVNSASNSPPVKDIVNNLMLYFELFKGQRGEGNGQQQQ